MEFSFKVELTPEYNVHSIYSDWIEKDWALFQEAIDDLGQEMLDYIHGVIDKNAKYKTKAKSSKLMNSIKLYRNRNIGGAEIGWGIGLKSEMNQLAPYWYLVNFGGLTWKGEYHITPGSFDEGGIFQYDPSSKKGKRLPSGTKGINYPLNYIQESQNQLDREVIMILTKIKAGTI